MGTKTTTFLSNVIKQLKGEDSESIAKKIQKGAVAQIKAQIAVKEAKTLELESEVEFKEEALDLARMNGGAVISRGDEYIKKLFVAESNLEEVKEALLNHLKSIEILKENLEIIQK